MITKKTLSRITVDIPMQMHKKLKALGALCGKSMKEIIIDCIEKHLGQTSQKTQDSTADTKSMEKHIAAENQAAKAAIKRYSAVLKKMPK